MADEAICGGQKDTWTSFQRVVFWFPAVNIIPPLLHIRLHLRAASTRYTNG